MMPADPTVKPLTVQQMADYFCRQSMQGRGQHAVELDLRGLAQLANDGCRLVLAIPPEGEQVDSERLTVFASARCG